MEPVNEDTAKYIITYYSHLLPLREMAALKHQRSLIKLDGDEDESRMRFYYRRGLLSKDPEVLDLLNAGPNEFIIKCAERILKKDPDKVFLNQCPVCKKLARTPYARQCRYCGHNWH